MKKITVIGVLLLLFALMTGCNEEQANPVEGSYYLYYTDLEATGLQSETYAATGTTPEELIEELIAGLVAQPRNTSYFSLFPEGVTIDQYEYVDREVTINMSAAYNSMPRTREILARAGLVRTLVQIDGVDTVRILVDGAPLCNSKGEEIGPMNADTFVENSGKEINSYENATMTLYFANEDGTKLKKESRRLYYSSNVPLERVVVEQVVKGPTVASDYPTVSPNSTILGVTVADGICYVNMGRDFADNALNIQQDVPIYSIVNSLIDSCDVSQVQIFIDGESNVIFRESMDLNQFYTKNEGIIEE